MREKLLDLICCPVCKKDLILQKEKIDVEGSIFSGILLCKYCNKSYEIKKGIPYLLEESFLKNKKNELNKTSKVYGFVWKKNEEVHNKNLFHAERMLNHFGNDCFEGNLCIDAGSGRGEDTLFLAKKYPKLEILSVDISEGVKINYEKTQNLPNVHVICASVLNLPIKEELVDFAYSYGVLHHTTNPFKGFRELVRTTKKNGRVILYLYENHQENLLKYLSIKCVTFVRKLTVKLPLKVLDIFSTLLSPFVVILFSWPSIFLKQFKKTKKLSDKIPFNFGKGLFSVKADLYDRFSAPIEFRYSLEEIKKWYEKEGFKKINVEKFKDISGIISCGVKE